MTSPPIFVCMRVKYFARIILSFHSRRQHFKLQTVKSTYVFATAAIAATVPIHGADIKPLIIGGTIVPAGTKTYMSGLRATSDGVTGCGGMLITSTHVLTAAHCTGYVKYIVVGSHFRTGTVGGERLPVKKEHPHPLYDLSGFGRDYDISVVELATPSTITPVKLLTADPETLVGAKSTAMGWGLRYDSAPEGSPELLRVDLPVVANAACKAAYDAGKVTPRRRSAASLA